LFYHNPEDIKLKRFEKRKKKKTEVKHQAYIRA